MSQCAVCFFCCSLLYFSFFFSNKHKGQPKPKPNQNQNKMMRRSSLAYSRNAISSRNEEFDGDMFGKKENEVTMAPLPSGKLFGRTHDHQQQEARTVIVQRMLWDDLRQELDSPLTLRSMTTTSRNTNKHNGGSRRSLNKS
mmetsp:Transcript_4011/g.9124  ORF Transcript_4011/g.9124 Transcript_4011/m.9124 type:complete len:141 (-) Transcript_4011:142-564(-)